MESRKGVCRMLDFRKRVKIIPPKRFLETKEKLVYPTEMADKKSGLIKCGLMVFKEEMLLNRCKR